jgi:hypothetical protein
MVKGLRVAASAALVLALLVFIPSTIPAANAAACNVSYGTVSGNTRYAIFNSGSACTWSVPSGVTSITYLVVGGGGGGGGARPAALSPNLGGGGGGAGGVVQSSTFSTSGGTQVTLTVGTGGSGGAAGAAGGNGGATSFTYSSTTVSVGGGGGGAGSSGTSDQDNLSGDGGSNASYSGGVNVWDGGGGGAGSALAGSNGSDIGGQGGWGGNGGTATVNALLGVNNYYGGGGGGGGTPSSNSAEFDGSGGSGGSGVGGNGGGGAGVLPGVGATNTGSGGGGGGWRYTSSDALRAGAAGADGKIIFTFTKNAGSVTAVSITSNSGADNTYKVGEVITASVSASEAITVTGAPRIPIVGLSGKYFSYTSGSGSSTLVFSYTVVLTDTASAGVGVGTNTLELNSGTLNDTAGLSISITHSAVAQSLSHRVDGILPTVTYTANINVNENETSTATLVLSESGSVTLGGGNDRAQFTFNSSTNTITFAPHDFENPVDADLNNVYYMNFSISDAAGNSGASTYNIFFTVINVAEVAKIGTPSLSAPAKKGISVTITVTADVAGKVDFFWNGKRIAGCLAVATSGTAPNLSALCQWKPTSVSAATIYAKIKPTSGSYSPSTSAELLVRPDKRTTLR